MVRQKATQSGIKKEVLYEMFEMSKQNYFQTLKRKSYESEMMKAVEKEVRQYRATVDQCAGSRTIYYNLNIKDKYKIGVNKMERLMSSYGLTLSIVRTKIITTLTCSKSLRYENIINGLTINGLSQVVVGDITYVRKDNCKYYVFTLFDLYSARMVGIYGGSRMRTQEALKALDQLVLLRGIKNLLNCIHHTDGGGQYFSNLYGEMIENKLKMRYSVAKTCLENGYAEQRNGMIKAHFLPLKRGRNDKEFNDGLIEIKESYNNRKQENLEWLSPIEFESKINKMDIKSKPEMKLHNFT